ncbi:MAG TPA: ABC transporter substrate-binding protein [Chthoniobacterales bacterium]|nr:ABC transporter substrate-binding protein [Chthoniobacterales bacterium]
MSSGKTVGLVVGVWLILISLLHATLNLGAFAPKNAGTGALKEPFRVGFIPVTCHLTCPVTDFINKQMTGSSEFEPVRFQGWPELKDAFISGYLPATFILAPLAMRMREDGVPIKIVYLGHRDGTAMVVNRESQIYQIEDLRGKTIAVPNRFSNQKLLAVKALQDHGVPIDQVKIVEMAPPDMPAALFSKAVDAITSGEPFMGQAEMDGYGRVLYLTKDVWPGFISCVLAVREDAIRDHRDVVQRLVDGIAKSGKWLDEKMDHRMEAADFVAQYYYNQNPRLLRFVLSKPPDRVTYTNLALRRNDFLEIEKLARQTGILQGKVSFDDYTDTSFVPTDSSIQPFAWDYAKTK